MADYGLYIRVFGPILFFIVLTVLFFYYPLGLYTPFVLVAIGVLGKDILQQPIRDTLRGIEPAIITPRVKDLSKFVSEVDLLERRLRDCKLKNATSSGLTQEDAEEIVGIVNARQILIDDAKSIHERIRKMLEDYDEVSIPELVDQLRRSHERQRELQQAFVESSEEIEES